VVHRRIDFYRAEWPTGCANARLSGFGSGGCAAESGSARLPGAKWTIGTGAGGETGSVFIRFLECLRKGSRRRLCFLGL
jgi:hypothetical protein